MQNHVCPSQMRVEINFSRRSKQMKGWAGKEEVGYLRTGSRKCLVYSAYLQENCKEKND